MHESEETQTSSQSQSETGMAEDDRSKDAFFAEVGDVAERMIEAHGKEFAMGVLVIGARFIAEGKPLVRPT